MGSISVTNLGKAYKQYPNRWARLTEWVMRGEPLHTLKWVLQDISFAVNQGEAVGIIGMNGAGKSTLLKMITGTTQPTTGQVSMTGRVAAMLELGMGFHPDFTGRQNAVMAGQLLGYSVEEIDRLMPEIEAFAEIGDYIDQPVRIYSSGMQVRLAFSVATAIRPDILIVDEALSVGDAYFVHKSFSRIREFRARGTTLLIVSHDPAAIQSICDRAILLESGRIAMAGTPETVFDFYSARLAAHQESSVIECIEVEGGKTRVESGSREATIESISIHDENGVPLSVVAVGRRVEVRIVVQVNSEIDGLVLGCGIKDRLGQMMFGTNTFYTKQKIEKAHNGDQFVFSVLFDVNLGVGSYSVHASLVKNDTHLDKNYHWVDFGHVFSVVNVDKPVFVGCMWNEMDFSVRLEKSGDRIEVS